MICDPDPVVRLHVAWNSFPFVLTHRRCKLILSFVSPLSFSLEGASSLATADADEISVTSCVCSVSLHDGTLKHMSNSILELHHIDALLLLCNPWFLVLPSLLCVIASSYPV
jgi:hypothetical protein